MTARRPITTKQRVEIFKAADGLCHICGGKIFKQWEVEHVIPLALGGADDPSNMRPAHPDCHAPKTAADVSAIAKAKRLEARHLGIKKPSRFPGAKGSKWKIRIGKPPVLRSEA